MLLAIPVFAKTEEEIELIEVPKEITWQDEFAKLPVELQRVAKCESSLNINAKNPHSTASGLFQFLDGTANWVYKELYGKPVTDKNNPMVQIEMAKWLYQNYGLTHWQYPCGTLK